MADFPTLPFHTDAYLADTEHLSLEEHGAYLKLLMVAWRSPGCSLPDDDKRIAIILGVSIRRWRDVLRPVIEPFWTIEGGFWRQKKLTKTREHVAKISLERRKAAEAKHRPKPLHCPETGPANAPPIDGANAPLRARVSKSKSKLTPLSPTSVGDAPPRPEPDAWVRLPQGWHPGPDGLAYALGLGLSRIEAEFSLERFVAHWANARGDRGLKCDWQSAWRAWVCDDARRKHERATAERGRRAVTAEDFCEDAIRHARRNPDEGPPADWTVTTCPMIEHEP